jgi:hypothetical protein
LNIIRDGVSIEGHKANIIHWPAKLLHGQGIANSKSRFMCLMSIWYAQIEPLLNIEKWPKMGIFKQRMKNKSKY